MFGSSVKNYVHWKRTTIAGFKSGGLPSTIFRLTASFRKSKKHSPTKAFMCKEAYAVTIFISLLISFFPHCEASICIHRCILPSRQITN